MYELARHQIHMLRGALPGSSARRLRDLLEASMPSAVFCTRGHRMSQSMMDCYTMREIEPGVYEYVRGACSDLPE